MEPEPEKKQQFEAVKKTADGPTADGGEISSSPVPAPAPQDPCVDAAPKQLHSFPVNSNLLPSTKVTEYLRPVAKHFKNKKIRILIYDVVKMWKDMLSNEKLKYVQNSKLFGGGNVDKVCIINLNNAPLHVQVAMVITCEEPTRNKNRKLFSDALAKVLNEINEEDIREIAKSRDPFQIAVDLESALFAKWGKYGADPKYKTKYRSVRFNIADDKNKDFRRKLLLGDIKAEELHTMTTEQMGSDARKLKNEKMRLELLSKCERKGIRETETNEYLCRRCGKREAKYYSLHTQTADGPIMTTFVTCLICDKSWKY